ncbi:hypothetical protein Aph02nite_04060 [Actinoplanes philippinensis]|uniref:Uncharacterized protein n=1 Tax=Actinoplanes philippinensis TaxID=35752 RepID=A0A1I2D5N5_9ACTN|nr:hypothetical protein [Actinoplanes philippinensis]GIE74456.1 hypothetical protein Aph02nite_04060 [Actinoplanes philippinensis]SFE75847.1 hypothetical protein SAMN05421541_103426 [Actinoplanes philippinensis]
MRRALYLGGIFLTTGAAVALAAPAQAADGDCFSGCAAEYGYVQSVSVDCGFGYFDACGSGDNYYSDKSIEQNGLLNVGLIDSKLVDSPISGLL